MIYTCYESMKEEAEKRLSRIAKKAARYNVPFSYSVGEEHPEKVNIHAYDEANHVLYVKATYTVSAVDFEINCDSLICQNGWKVIAKLEHGDKGNIVTAFNCDIQDAWYQLPARCDHCNTNRFRSVTFLCEKDGEVRQVGRSCLKDYTGISPEVAVMFAEVRDIFPETLDCSEQYFIDNKIAAMYDVERVLAHAVDCIANRGYCKSDSNNSTKDQVIDKLNEEPSSQAKEKAAKIVEWLKQETFGSFDIERNCQILALAGYAKRKHFGRLVYMPVAYDKYIERKVIEQQRESEKASERSSNYVGAVGEKLIVNVATVQLVTTFETQFGITYLYKMVDTNGNVFVWFASNRNDEVKGSITIKGTVKAHSERDGVKQTVLTRCKVC